MLKGIHQRIEAQESPAFFVSGPRPFSRVMFFCGLSILLMAMDARFDTLKSIRNGFIATLHPLEVIASAPNEWGRHINFYFTSHQRLLNENYQLRQQTLIDRTALQRLSSIEAENGHLRTLLLGDAPLIPQAVLGEIMHMGRDPFSNVIVINRGNRHGVDAGQAVVDGAGVIGQVTRVYPFSSEVTLITDKHLSIPIQIERNQLRAIAFGAGKGNSLDVPYLPTSVDIQKGDKLVTSGIDGVYPPGLAVATVTRIEQSPDSPFAKIVSEPVAGVNNHRQVLILKLPPPTIVTPTQASDMNSQKLIDDKTKVIGEVLPTTGETTPTVVSTPAPAATTTASETSHEVH